MYKILEHSADEKFHAEASTREEAFSEVVNAFVDIVDADTEGMYRHSVSVESENLEALLYDFLDELIFLQDSEGVVISHAERVDFEELEDGFRVEADLLVDTITSDMSPLDIKAPTYNEMRTDYEDGAWILEAVLDV